MDKTILDKEHINSHTNSEKTYQIQTNKHLMISSLIRYNSEENSYILDLTKKDAELLEISEQDYNNALDIVSKLNNNIHNSLK